ncbi:MAG: heparinase II/III family protein [Chloroflexi bacterium]|nr:heparinase II/III family protein [Chloroflexota bacterium]
MPTKLETLLEINAPTEDLISRIRQSPARASMLEMIRRAAPDLKAIPQTPYTLYREFEYTGMRDGYQQPYYLKRSLLTRAVVEMMLGDDSMRDHVHDLLWSICEETTWLLPAHEEQGPDFWELHPSPRAQSWGAHTMLTREPDSIDLFAAETGASLAETIHWLGDRLAPEVVQRVRQQVERHIFKPYLAYARKHWWYKGALNWNGVCNGAIGLAFLRLERDPRTLAEALSLVLEGFEAYIATGFEPDGGSIEGISYWNYGLMYYVTLAELLRERTNGKLDLLAAPRLRDIARYPLGMALSRGVFVNFGDAVEEAALAPGIVQRIAERTGVNDLRALVLDPDHLEASSGSTAKLAIVLRDMAWWDGAPPPIPASARQDFFLPDCAIAKLTGQTSTSKPVALVAKAGHNDGHHSHTDVGHFILHVDGESLLCDPGRGLYSREYFRQPRYENMFCNSIGHSVPRLGGQLQMPGPEFGGHKQFHGEIIAHGEQAGAKFVVIEMQNAYDVSGLTLVRRTLRLTPGTGETSLEDVFEFQGTPLAIEEAFVTWFSVQAEGATARIVGQHSALALSIEEPRGATFRATRLEQACRENHRQGVLTRLSIELPNSATRFRMRLVPQSV